MCLALHIINNTYQVRLLIITDGPILIYYFNHSASLTLGFTLGVVCFMDLYEQIIEFIHYLQCITQNSFYYKKICTSLHISPSPFPFLEITHHFY